MCSILWAVSWLVKSIKYGEEMRKSNHDTDVLEKHNDMLVKLVAKKPDGKYGKLFMRDEVISCMLIFACTHHTDRCKLGPTQAQFGPRAKFGVS